MRQFAEMVSFFFNARLILHPKASYSSSLVSSGWASFSPNFKTLFCAERRSVDFAFLDCGGLRDL